MDRGNETSRTRKESEMGRKVTVIPPTISLQTHLPTTQKVKRKVAGYARVSTDFEEQLTSYEAQVDYYTDVV